MKAVNMNINPIMPNYQRISAGRCPNFNGNTSNPIQKEPKLMNLFMIVLM